MNGFGLAPLKTEGAHAHPDDPHHGYWGDDDGIYIKQLCGYVKDNNLDLETEFAGCRKPELLEKALNQ